MNKAVDINNLAHKLVNDKWMILPSYHKSLCEQLEKCASGEAIEKLEHELDAKFDEQIDEIQELAGPVTAIVEVNGVLMKHPSMFDMLFGAMDVDDVYYALQNAAQDENVKDVILWFNSPGGVTTGIEELGRYIQECSKVKPIYAFTDSMCCSAAYWLASQCDAVFSTPSGMVGSIGVFALVEDITKKLDQEGVKVEQFVSGKFKTMGHPFHTLTPDEKKYLQADVEAQHEKFRQTVLGKRPDVPVEAMEGLSYEGEEALKLNLVDGLVDSLEELIGEIQSENGENQNSMKNITKKVAVKPTVKTEAASPEAPKTADTAVVEKKEGKYDGQYQEEKGDKIPGLPGVNEEEEGKYDGQYQEDGPVDKPDKGDPNRDAPLQDPDGETSDTYTEEEEEECTCEKCGSKYKTKKAKKSEHPEPDGDETPEGEEPEDDEDEEETDKPTKKMTAEEVAKTMKAEPVLPTPTELPKVDYSKQCNESWRTAIKSVASFAKVVKEPDSNLSDWQKAMMEFRNPKE